MRCPFLPPTSPEDECKLFTVQLAAVNVRASRVLSANCPKEWEKQKFRNCVQSWSTLVFLQISHILYPMKNFSQQDIPALLPYVQMKYVRSRYAIHSRGDKIPTARKSTPRQRAFALGLFSRFWAEWMAAKLWKDYGVVFEGTVDYPLGGAGGGTVRSLGKASCRAPFNDHSGTVEAVRDCANAVDVDVDEDLDTDGLLERDVGAEVENDAIDQDNSGSETSSTPSTGEPMERSSTAYRYENLRLSDVSSDSEGDVVGASLNPGADGGRPGLRKWSNTARFSVAINDNPTWTLFWQVLAEVKRQKAELGITLWPIEQVHECLMTDYGEIPTYYRAAIEKCYGPVPCPTSHFLRPRAPRDKKRTTEASSSNQSPEGSSAAVSAPTSALERFLATEFGEGGPASLTPLQVANLLQDPVYNWRPGGHLTFEETLLYCSTFNIRTIDEMGSLAPPPSAHPMHPAVAALLASLPPSHDTPVPDDCAHTVEDTEAMEPPLCPNPPAPLGGGPEARPPQLETPVPDDRVPAVDDMEIDTPLSPAMAAAPELVSDPTGKSPPFEAEPQLIAANPDAPQPHGDSRLPTEDGPPPLGAAAEPVPPPLFKSGLERFLDSPKAARLRPGTLAALLQDPVFNWRPGGLLSFEETLLFCSTMKIYTMDGMGSFAPPPSPHPLPDHLAHLQPPPPPLSTTAAVSSSKPQSSGAPSQRRNGKK
jgi:hypothetical protein